MSWVGKGYSVRRHEAQQVLLEPVKLPAHDRGGSSPGLMFLFLPCFL
jgi:hypothetical protein